MLLFKLSSNVKSIKTCEFGKYCFKFGDGIYFVTGNGYVSKYVENRYLTQTFNISLKYYWF